MMHRPLRCLLLFVLVGCYSVGRRPRDFGYVDIPMLVHASVRLSPSDSVTLLPSRFATGDRGWRVEEALEVGGRLVLVTEDSIVLTALYLVVRDSTRQDGWRRMWLGKSLPMSAIVRPTSGAVVRPYSPPRTREDVRAARATSLMFAAAGAALSIYYIRTSHW